MQGIELCARLDGQLIKRDMPIGDAKPFTQLRPPGLGIVFRARIDQIKRKAIKDRGRHIQRTHGFLGTVQATKEFQVTVIKRLNANRYPVDPVGGKGRKTVNLDRARIGFERDLQIIRHRPERFDVLDQGPGGFRVHQGWRATTKEDRSHRPPRMAGRTMGKLGPKCCAPARVINTARHMTVEIAIRAFRQAERPVDIDAKRHGFT